MPVLEEMTAHLMRFVRVGSRQYAVQAALDYAKLDPWELADLPASLDVAISLWRKERAEAKAAHSESRLRELAKG